MLDLHISIRIFCTMFICFVLDGLLQSIWNVLLQTFEAKYFLKGFLENQGKLGEIVNKKWLLFSDITVKLHLIIW